MGKPGRKLHYETDEEIWDEFQLYRDDVKKNPRISYEFHGRNGEKRRKRLERPLTLEGFYNWCADRKGDVKNYFENTEGRYERFKGICTRVRNNIRQDQIEGGMVGQYNASITQRLNGLKEQSETTITEQPLFGKDD